MYDLGLIYDLKVDDAGQAFINMTLTAPGCPVAGILPGQAGSQRLRTVPGITGCSNSNWYGIRHGIAIECPTRRKLQLGFRSRFRRRAPVSKFGCMKLTAHEEYGFRCLLQIGKRGVGESLTIPEISEAEGISGSYAAKLLRILRQGGFVTSVRGKDLAAIRWPVPRTGSSSGKCWRCWAAVCSDADFCGSHAGHSDVCVRTRPECSIRTLWQRVRASRAR